MFINTQAVQIDENTYPLAVACLGAQIAGLPVDDVIGNYLVINQLTSTITNFQGHARYGRVRPNDRALSLQNFMIEKADFEARYKFVGAGAPPKEKKLRSVKMLAERNVFAYDPEDERRDND